MNLSPINMIDFFVDKNIELSNKVRINSSLDILQEKATATARTIRKCE